MKISTISAGTGSSAFTLSGDNAIRLLEKQKMQLQEQIQKTSESKLDDKIKQDRIKQLQEQIQQIDIQIQQKRSEKLSKSQNQDEESKTADSRAKDTGHGENVNTGDISSLVQASTSYSQAKTMNRVKRGLNAKADVLRTEIKLDEGRGGNAERKRAELQKLEAREQNLEGKVGDTLQSSQKQVREASEQEGESNGDTQESKPQRQEETGTDRTYPKVDIRA